VVYTANHLTDTDKQNSTEKYSPDLNSLQLKNRNNAEYSKNKTTLVLLEDLQYCSFSSLQSTRQQCF